MQKRKLKVLKDGLQKLQLDLWKQIGYELKGKDEDRRGLEVKVKLARTAGFCMGVRRAMNIVLDAAHKKKGKLYTYGPLVHNPQAIDMLQQKGVEVLRELTAVNATVIIRAHGIPPDERKKLKEAGNLICDATCPHVARAQAIIKKETREGYNTIIVGDRGHAEVRGLLGYADGGGFVIENTSEIDSLPEMEKACLIAQTTQDRKVFLEAVEKAKTRIKDIKVFDTICDSTAMRQKEVVELAKEADAMVIVGGKNSANTKRLHEISAATGVPSFHIEEEDELDSLGLERFKNIGVMAGASTPNWVITKIMDRIKYLQKKRQSQAYVLFERVGEFIVESSLYLGIGAVSMCYASLVFQEVRPALTILAIAFLYVFGVHIFNRLNERLKDEFFDPGRTRFFRDYGKMLNVSAIVASCAALYLSYMLGMRDFILLLFSYLMGVFYSLRIVPERFRAYTKYQRIKDIPGSKDIFVALAWAWVIVLIPMLNKEIFLSYKSLAILIFVPIMVFIRSVIFDIVSIEGDRIIGRETIPILIGSRNTQGVLSLLLVATASFMISSAYLGLVPSLGYYLVLPLGFMPACLYFFQKKRIQSGVLFEAVIDSNFIIAGLITYLWQLG